MLEAACLLKFYTVNACLILIVTAYFAVRLVDELILVYKESANREEAELICSKVVYNLKLLKQ